MQITRAKPEDAATLTAIAFAAKRHWHYPEQWIEPWRDLLTISPEFVAGHDTYTAIVDGRIVGFCALDREGNRTDLVHMWVLPEAVGRGVGRTLFFHALEHAKALGFRKLVIESDPNAEGFYRRLGARRVGTNVYTVEVHRRELPMLIYDIEMKADS